MGAVWLSQIDFEIAVAVGDEGEATAVGRDGGEVVKARLARIRPVYTSPLWLAERREQRLGRAAPR